MVLRFVHYHFVCINTVIMVNLFDRGQHCVFVIGIVTINEVIADKKVVTNIINNSTGLQRIELNGFTKCYFANLLLPLCIWLVFRPVLRPRLVPVV